MWHKVLELILLALILLALIFKLPIRAVEVQGEMVYVEVPVEVPVEVEVLVEVPVETLIEVPIELREFESLGELEGWLDENIGPIVFIGSTNLSSPLSDPRFDCDDYAERLQKRALNNGYYMSLQLVEDGHIFGIEVLDMPEAHMGCLTMIGNDIYYIEPLPPNKAIIRVASRD